MTSFFQALKRTLRLSHETKKGVSIGNGFLVKGDVLDTENENFYQKRSGHALNAFCFGYRTSRNQQVFYDYSSSIRKLGQAYSRQLLLRCLMKLSPASSKILKAKKVFYHCLKRDEQTRDPFQADSLHSAALWDSSSMIYSHAYTVDQHTILAISYLRRFTKSENAHARCRL